jgi:hypothetical protein
MKRHIQFTILFFAILTCQMQQVCQAQLTISSQQSDHMHLPVQEQQSARPQQSIRAQQPVQTIRGTVYDASSREPLYGANIILAELNKGTITDTDGSFILDHVPVGRYSLHIRFVGYEPILRPELLVSSGKEVVLDIAMQTDISDIEEVTVKPSARKDRPINSMANVSARTFSVEEAGRYAGALDDPGRMAGNFAGVTSPGVHVNAVVVRGNAPKGMQWRLEGVDIPVPSHFSGSNVAGGGGLTMFSSSMLTNSDFYTGAFPAEYGNATAGVFDMKLRNGNNSKREYSFQAGVQGIEAALEGPLGGKAGGSYLLNYRYSTMALVFPLLPELKFSDEIPVYQDLSFKVNLPAGKAGNLSIWGIGGLSSTSMKGTDEVTDWIYPERRVQMNFHYNMGTAGITHTKGLSAKTFLRSTLAVNSGQHLYNKESRLDPGDPAELFPLYDIGTTSSMAILSTSLTHVAGPRLTLRTGIDANELFYTLHGDARDYEAGELKQIMDGSGNSMLLKGYLQGKYDIGRNVALTGGTSLSWFGLNGELRLEPRFSARWQPFSSHSFSLGYGNHSQTEPLFVYFVTRTDNATGERSYPNKSLERMGAHHFVLGYDWSVTDNLRLKLEPYYQLLYNVPVVAGSPYSMVNFLADWTFDRVLVNEGTGSNRGIDLTVERFLKQGYYFMTTASLYKSEYKGGDGIVRRTRYDGGYVLNLLGGREWQLFGKNMLGLNIKCTFMGPYWYHPVDEAATVLAQSIVYDEDMPFTDRHTGVESISDVMLSYRVNGRSVSTVFTLQVRNALGSQYQGKRFNLVTQAVEDEFFSSAVPFVSCRVEF